MSKYSAAGLDQWTVHAVKALPGPILEKLCAVFAVIEESQCWPSSLTIGYLSLIPKPDSDNFPSSLRPLSILSVLYRAWPSMRLSELMRWQESWAHASQSGFRSLHSCLDAWYPLAISVEKSQPSTRQALRQTSLSAGSMLRSLKMTQGRSRTKLASAKTSCNRSSFCA